MLLNRTGELIQASTVSYPVEAISQGGGSGELHRPHILPQVTDLADKLQAEDTNRKSVGVLSRVTVSDREAS
jgi:hypothetical protein